MISRLKSAPWLATLVALLLFGQAQAADSRKDVKRALAKAEYRGQVVFKTYCWLCHGERGDGIARATKLHGKVKLRITSRSKDYFEKIIRKGGEAVNRSAMMPPWEDELTDEQINDVIAYMAGVTNPIKRGEAVYKTNCILCHGINANGKGRAAKLYDPPPANLRKSKKNDDYLRRIITLGGEAMGRSAVMPVWGQQLTAQEIDDVVSYLRSIIE